MARRKKGNAVNGWLVLDKPIGMTSTQAVGAVRRAYNAQKAGHAGTLDPLASGILPIALGEATKTVPFAVDGEKVYRFAVRWGAETTTDDTEGNVAASSDTRPSRTAIEALLPSFTGEILQVPPQFSASFQHSPIHRTTVLPEARDPPAEGTEPVANHLVCGSLNAGVAPVLLARVPKRAQ